MEVIRSFLKEVVKIVPLESITFAIANSKPDEIANRCAKALISANEHAFLSKLMAKGYLEAKKRICDGVLPTSLGLKGNTKLKRTPVKSSSKSQKLSEVQRDMKKMYEKMSDEEKTARKQGNPIPIICGKNIGCLYPTSTEESPLEILRSRRNKLGLLAKEIQEGTPEKQNRCMLNVVNKIRQGDLATCTSLLGGFMEQRKIDIPLVKARSDRSEALRVCEKARVSVWALSNLNYSGIQDILARCRGKKLLVKIQDHIATICRTEEIDLEGARVGNRYKAKLQFMVQGEGEPVTYNTHYSSYSLECQLSELCKERKIHADLPLEMLVGEWEKRFKNNILSLVAHSHHQLIARWLLWALMVHNLRKELAKHTAVGIVGLVNSGKSTLVNSLFRIKVGSL